MIDLAETAAGQLHWTAALVNVWRSRGQPPTPELRHAARELAEALRTAGLSDNGEADG